MKRIAILLPCLLILLATVGCGRSDYHKSEGMIWNTTYHITYQGPESLADSILPILSRVGDALNVFDPTSLVSRVNSGISTPVDSDFIKVYLESGRINRISNGAFDPTLSPLITAWGFGKGHTATPDTARIDSIMKFVGLGRTRLEGKTLVKSDKRTQFNFSAIAKGYACDEVGRMLARNGCMNYLVEIGGEIAASGNNPSGSKWRISIDRPLLQDSILHDSQCIVEISDVGVATSGNYRNFHTDAQGRNYGHTISAVTGRPVRTDVLSATIIAQTGMQADALATACMALGSRAARQLCDSLDIPALLVLADSTVWASPKFSKISVN